MVNVLAFILGLIGLWIGAELIVKNGKNLAKSLGVSELFIGLTIVSVGTSIPEIMVSLFSGFRGYSDIAIGSMVGSDLTQITLVLGLAGLIHNIKVDPKAIRVDGMMLLIVIGLFFLTLRTDYFLTRFEGAALALFYLVYLIYTAKHDALSKQAEERSKAHHWKEEPEINLFLSILLIVSAFAVLFFSADLVLDNATALARASGLSAAFIGVMVIGAATCLPELTAAVVGAIRKSPSISIGVLIGSNITDPLLSVGLGATIRGFSVDKGLLFFDIPFWFVSTILALLLLHRKILTLNRQEASILVAVYFIFVFAKLSFFV